MSFEPKTAALCHWGNRLLPQLRSRLLRNCWESLGGIIWPAKRCGELPSIEQLERELGLENNDGDAADAGGDGV